MGQRYQRQIEFEGRQIPVKIHIESRAYARVSVGVRGINIRIPQHFSAAKRYREIDQLSSWAVSKLKAFPDRFTPPQPKIYRDGDQLSVGGKSYRLSLLYLEKKTSSARLEAGEIRLRLSKHLTDLQRQEQTGRLIARCIGTERLPQLEERIRGLNERYFQRKVGTIRFKNNRSNWGSCSRKGNINISVRLLLAPESVLQYVCVHELAHLIERKHSPRFWTLVERVDPDFRDHRRWLRENGKNTRF